MLSYSIKLITISLILSFNITFSQINNFGTISGKVADLSTGQPLEFVNVVVISSLNNSPLTGAITDKNGLYKIENLPIGTYSVKFSMVGYEIKNITNSIIDQQHRSINTGTVSLKAKDVNLNEVTIKTNKIMLNNSIDRKVFNVEQDIMSKTGSASDLLQNIPSVQVDMDGNVSLRGSTDVLILINGKPSPLMDNATRADVLQQMPANSIEKIEVITNPSAKYKPDGSSGIINIVLKKETNTGLNGNLGASIGFNDRYNSNASFNYKPGRFNLFGIFSLRQDNRYGFTSDNRIEGDTLGNRTGYYKSESISGSNPFSKGSNLGFDFSLDNLNSFGATGNYFYRDFTRNDKTDYVLSDVNYILTENYSRFRLDNEYQKSLGATSYFQHNFSGEDNKLRIDFNVSHSSEQEDNHYNNVYGFPINPEEFDNTIIKQDEYKNQLQVEYSLPISENSQFEAGYDGEFNKSDMNHFGSYMDPISLIFVTDPQKTNHFIYNEDIHAFYSTYSNTFGAFSFLAGLRLEKAFIKSDLVSSDSVLNNDYFNFFPTIHLRYKLSDVFQIQLNYSKRVNRPEGDDLNPFPEYQDPRNIRSGNPGLKPEFIHSIEFGLQWQNEFMTIIPSLFYRDRYNVMTPVVSAINDSTLLTRRENLSSDQSAGFEFIVSGGYTNYFSANLSANAFYEEIDATNLGFGKNKSTVSYSGNMSLNFNLPYSTMLQVNSNYRSKRLTPQGEFAPSFVMNLGIRKDLFDDKLSIIFTISDLFRTLNRKLSFDTPWLIQDTYNVRDSRIIYFGLTYHFGKPSKKEKEKALQYDNSL